MELNTITTVLIALCPTISAILTAIIGFLSLVKTIRTLKDDNAESVKNSTQRIDRMEKKLNTLVLKISSIEQYLAEQKEKQR